MRLRNIDWLILVWRYRFFPSLLNAITAVQGGDLQEAEAGDASGPPVEIAGEQMVAGWWFH